MSGLPYVTEFQQDGKLVKVTRSKDPDWATVRAQYHLRTQKYNANFALVYLAENTEPYSSTSYTRGSEEVNTIYERRYRPVNR